MGKRRCDVCGKDNREVNWPGVKVYSCGHFACSECGRKYSKCPIGNCKGR